MPFAQCPGMWQPTIQAAAGVSAGTVQTRSTRSPERTTIRTPATSGGTLTTGVGPGGAPTVAASATSQASWTRGVADDGLVDLETAVDDVEQHGLAGHEVEGVGRNE